MTSTALQTSEPEAIHLPLAGKQGVFWSFCCQCLLHTFNISSWEVWQLHASSM